MSRNATVWATLERWAPRLFVVAGVFSLIAAANYGITWAMDSITFNDWIGLSVLLARVASLLAVAGLSVRLVETRRRLGLLSRAVVIITVLFAIGLLATAVLQNLGIEQPLSSVFGLGTVTTSLLTYTLFGLVILRTDVSGTLVGVLLLGATVALLIGLFARVALPIGVVGTIAELLLVVTHVGIGYSLMTQSSTSRRQDAPVGSTTE